MGRIQLENRVKPYKILLKTFEPGLKFLEKTTTENEFVPLRYFLHSMIPFLKECINKAGEGMQIVAHHFAFPSKLLYFFEVVPVTVEAVSYVLTGTSEKYYDLMTNWGHPYHTCSAQKGVMGMTLDNLFKFDAVVTPSAPCDNSIASYPVFQHLQVSPSNFLVLDMPYYRDNRSYDYFSEELIRVRNELGKILGQEPDEERFRKAIEIENKNYMLLKEIHELKKAIPCPIDSMIVPLTAMVNLFLNARQERTEFLEKTLEYAKTNYRKKIKPNGEEKVRTIWPNMCIYYDPQYCEELDRKKGVSILFDIFTYLFYDPINLDSGLDEIFRQLAIQCMEYPMTRQAQHKADQMIEDMIYLSREYSADAAIFTNHIACKGLQPMIQLLREALREELGIPLLSIDIDVGDKRFTSLRIVKRKVNNFLKTLF